MFQKNYFLGKFALLKQVAQGVNKRLVHFTLGDQFDPDVDLWPWGGGARVQRGAARGLHHLFCVSIYIYTLYKFFFFYFFLRDFIFKRQIVHSLVPYVGTEDQRLLYHRTCKPDFLCSWPSLNSHLK